ncbi:Copia protein, partial [Habropoda laboriosa]
RGVQPPIKISVTKNGTYITATKRGTIQVVNNMGVEGTLENVLYCHDVPYNLLSVRRMQEAGMEIIFDQKGVTINKNDKIVIKGKSLNNLTAIHFIVNIKRVVSNRFQIHSVISNNYELWHQRLGHMGKFKFLELKNKQMVDDINHIERVVPNDNLCEACIKGKQARLSFEKKKDKEFIETFVVLLLLQQLIIKISSYCWLMSIHIVV